MAVRQVAENKATKDGRRWCFYTRIKTNSKSKLYVSKNYMTKEDAQIAERDFLIKMDKSEFSFSTMTFKELYDEFYEYKKDKVKKSTLRTYRANIKKLDDFYDLKIKDINLNHYIDWRKRISNLKLKDKTKNGYYKLLKALLNYGTRWHDFNFTSIYNKMEKFHDPNKIPEEMQFYTWEEFKQFISVIHNLKWESLFEILFFCGLRRGELLGLTWNNIDFTNKQISIVKNVVQIEDKIDGKYTITTPKTRTSIRTLPVPQKVINDLELLYNKTKKSHNFSDTWFVFGRKKPLAVHVLRNMKNKYAKEANVKQIRIHDFRHSCASVLINNGASIMIVAKYLGHSKIDQTLNTYSHLFKNKLDEIVQTLDSLE